MDQKEYEEIYKSLAAAGEANDSQEILKLTRRIIESDLPEQDQVVAWVNSAQTHGVLGDWESAMSCFESARKIATALTSSFVLEAKAHFLYDHRRLEESVAVYKELLETDGLSLEQRKRVEENIQSLEEILSAKP